MKSSFPSKEYSFSKQRTGIFFFLSLFPPEQSKSGVEPLRCLLLFVSKLAHCLARQLGVLVGSQINILSPASAEVEKWAFQR